MQNSKLAKGSKVYWKRNQSLTGTVVAIMAKPLEKDLRKLYYKRGRWHNPKRASAGERLIMVEWNRPNNLHKWISENSVTVIEPIAEIKEQIKETTGENIMNKYKITFSDNGEQMFVEAENLVELTPLMKDLNSKGRGYKINRVTDPQVVENTKTTNKGESAMTQVKETCPRCKGTGLYLPKEGAKCFKCDGQKVVMYNKMTDRQIAKIRSLFKQVREAMTIDEQESLITKMNEHNNGANIRSTVWANKAIEKLIKIQTTQMGR